MSKILKVLTKENPNLRKKSAKIRQEIISSDELNALIDDMSLTMKKKDGIGLAAPQIGRNWRLICIAYKDDVLALINPEIVKKSWKKEWDEEGCLSVPKTFGQVKRHHSVVCNFIDKDGNKNILEAEGLLARILQHEIDHLDGVLFIDRAKKIYKVK